MTCVSLWNKPCKLYQTVQPMVLHTMTLLIHFTVYDTNLTQEAEHNVVLRLILTGEQTQLWTALHHRGYRNTLVYFLWNSTRAIMPKPKSWESAHHGWFGSSVQEKLWEGQYSGIRRFPMSFLLFGFVFCASCWNRQPTFSSFTPKFNCLPGATPVAFSGQQMLDWSPIWYLSLLSINLLLLQKLLFIQLNTLNILKHQYFHHNNRSNSVKCWAF